MTIALPPRDNGVTLIDPAADRNGHAGNVEQHHVEGADGIAKKKRRGAWVTLMTGDVYLPGLA